MDPAVPVPHALLARYRHARRIVEVGAGRRFDAALAFAAACPRAEVVVTDVREHVLQAPPPLRAVVDDALRPHMATYRGADLVTAVRPPEELQPAIARLARRAGAHLAIRPLATELVDLAPHGGRPEVIQGWRLYTG